MKILRVRVPEYRALKDVDISFEPDFVPNIFPLGSQNGGGKSTLLQLLFAFLSFDGDLNNSEYLRNMLRLVERPIVEDKKLLITVDVLIDEQNYEISLYLSNNSFLKKIFNCDGPASVLMKLASTKTKGVVYQEKIYFLTSYIVDEKNTYCSIVSVFNQESKEKEYIDDCFLDYPSFIKKLFDKIYLFSPLTQICLFLDKVDRSLLLNKNLEQSIEYAKCLAQTKEKLPNFFTYDFAAEDIFIKAIKAVRDRDFAQAIESNGQHYGENYKTLLEIFKMLGNKVIKPSKDLSSISFNLIQTQQPEKQISITDLSHGELKRLSILIWLIANEIEDAVILMDELEIGFHPDWQYQIIKDLEKWGPKNQYIIATHSYEICEALTPKHVKTLEPRLPAKT